MSTTTPPQNHDMRPGEYITPGHYGPIRQERTFGLKGSSSSSSASFDALKWKARPLQGGRGRPHRQRLGGEGVGEVTLFNQRVPLPLCWSRKKSHEGGMHSWVVSASPVGRDGPLERATETPGERLRGPGGPLIGPGTHRAGPRKRAQLRYSFPEEKPYWRQLLPGRAASTETTGNSGDIVASNLQNCENRLKQFEELRSVSP